MVIGYIFIKILCQQNYFQITEKTFIEEVINPFALISRNSFIVIMSYNLASHTFQHLYYNKVFKESFSSGIWSDINQFGTDFFYNMGNIP